MDGTNLSLERIWYASFATRAAKRLGARLIPPLESAHLGFMISFVGDIQVTDRGDFCIKMKLRILENTLRFRLSRPDIERFIAGDAVLADVTFPGSGTLHIHLQGNSAQGPSSATFADGSLEVRVPSQVAQTLAAPEAVTIDEAVTGDDGVELQFKIEKDFRCLMPRDEDESALYEHPRGD